MIQHISSAIGRSLTSFTSICVHGRAASSQADQRLFLLQQAVKGLIYEHGDTLLHTFPGRQMQLPQAAGVAFLRRDAGVGGELLYVRRHRRAVERAYRFW